MAPVDEFGLLGHSISLWISPERLSRIVVEKTSMLAGDQLGGEFGLLDRSPLKADHK